MEIVNLSDNDLQRDGLAKTREELIAEICAAPPNDVSEELAARLAAIPDDARDALYDRVSAAVAAWLAERRVCSDDFEASFRQAGSELIFVASIVIRAMKKRLGQDLSPAHFAIHCYGVGHNALNWSDFAEEAAEVFEDGFTPREEYPHETHNAEEDDRVRPSIVAYLRTQSRPVRRSDLLEHVKETVAGPKERTYIEYALRRVLKTLIKEGQFVAKKDGIRSWAKTSTLVLCLRQGNDVTTPARNY